VVRAVGGRQQGREGRFLATHWKLAALASSAAPAGAYGGGTNHDMWQVGLSFNCNNPDLCTPHGRHRRLLGLGGVRPLRRRHPNLGRRGVRVLRPHRRRCFAGGGHTSIEIESWTIAPGSAGPQTFYAGGEETDTFGGTKTTFVFTNQDTGISAVPGHYSTSDVLSFTAPGVAIQIQVAFRPAK
jgi:hypothetical protein